ncbi:MAG: hypothetical protein AMXMBFR82_13720 [Candidatus Hydrogenedentota bacterium]
MKLGRVFSLAMIGVVALAACLTANAEPRHVFLTYSDAPETSIDINVILDEHEGEVQVYYDTESHDGKLEDYAHHVTAPYIQTLMVISDERALAVATLTGLEPGTEYYFVAGEDEFGMSKERKFRTLPGGDEPIRFVTGGDMGVDGFVISLLGLVAEEAPDFGVIGGDIPYANGLLGRPDLWDKWLHNWDHLTTSDDGRMVPIVTAIGNHETNDYISDNFELRAPWYMALFGRQAENIYYTRKFGDNMVMFVLDSGHLVPHEAQVPWLEQEMAKHQDVPFKFALYHVPLYPAHRDYEGGGSVAGRTHWLPIFDKYGLTVGMENHDHVFKRTKVLKGNEVADEGTVYIGDGCFGRAPREIDPQPRWYNEKEAAKAHFWVVDVKKDGVDLKAIDAEGLELDRFSLTK